jgi:Yip1 domain
MATTPVPAPAPQPSISPIGRIFGVLFSPKSTFEDIVRKPSWIPAMALLVLTGLALNITLANRTNWVEVSKEQIAKNKFAARAIDQLDDAKKDQAYQRGATQAKITTYVRGVIGWPLMLLFSGLIYFGAYRLIGGARVSYGLSFTICAFAYLPMGIREILGAIVSALKDPNAIDPSNYLASNPAAFLGSDAPAWQMVPLMSLDLFAVWILILIAMGFSAADPKKLPFGKALGIGIGLQVCLVAFFTGLAWIFS